MSYVLYTFFQGQELQSGFTTGVSIFNSTLRLFRIGPKFAGAYLCQITTDKNETLCSNPLRINVVHVRIQFTPLCLHDEYFENEKPTGLKNLALFKWSIVFSSQKNLPSKKIRIIPTQYARKF